ncbi:hypothetical protein AB0N46_28895 [Streptomyces albidoflavus]|uniref:hypothetical protein n=1 Tax=Streptomyces TaxID=1883 RepID=UPI0016469FC8|nr:hypothetical protein [Streptomyces sp. CBG33]
MKLTERSLALGIGEGARQGFGDDGGLGGLLARLKFRLQNVDPLTQVVLEVSERCLRMHSGEVQGLQVESAQNAERLLRSVVGELAHRGTGGPLVCRPGG